MSVSSASRVAHRLLEILHNEWSKKCFSICLTSSCGDLIYKHSDLLKHGVCYHYKVPENLCRVFKHINSPHAVDHDGTSGHLDGSIVGSQARQSLLPSRPILSTAAILALFDEISTYSMAIHDRGHRPGLSIHLSTEVIKPHSLQSGSNIKIMTRVDKIGRTIGFCSLEVLSADNELLARGKHIKYLPMGAIFDLLVHPFLFPIVLKIYEWFYEPKIKATRHIPPKSFPSLDGIGRVFNILGLSAASDEERRALLGPMEAQHFYVMTVKEITSNMLGNMHGGAVGIAIEQACIRSRLDSRKAETGQSSSEQQEADGAYELQCYIKHIDIRYIAPMSGDIVVSVRDDSYSPGLQDRSSLSSRSVGQVLKKKDGQVCAEYECTWAML